MNRGECRHKTDTFKGSVVLAALTAAGFSLGFNFFMRRAGPFGIIYLGPIFEEWAKTGMAILFSAPVPGTHIVFGMLEALGDCFWGGRLKLLAALCGIAAHTFFGLVTYFIIDYGYGVQAGVLTSIAVHIAWNRAVLKLSGLKGADR